MSSCHMNRIMASPWGASNRLLFLSCNSCNAGHSKFESHSNYESQTQSASHLLGHPAGTSYRFCLVLARQASILYSLGSTPATALTSHEFPLLVTSVPHTSHGFPSDPTDVGPPTDSFPQHSHYVPQPAESHSLPGAVPTAPAARVGPTAFMDAAKAISYQLACRQVSIAFIGGLKSCSVMR